MSVETVSRVLAWVAVQRALGTIDLNILQSIEDCALAAHKGATA